MPLAVTIAGKQSPVLSGIGATIPVAFVGNDLVPTEAGQKYWIVECIHTDQTQDVIDFMRANAAAKFSSLDYGYYLFGRKNLTDPYVDVSTHWFAGFGWNTMCPFPPGTTYVPGTIYPSDAWPCSGWGVQGNNPDPTGSRTFVWMVLAATPEYRLDNYTAKASFGGILGWGVSAGTYISNQSTSLFSGLRVLTVDIPDYDAAYLPTTTVTDPCGLSTVLATPP